MIIIKAKVTCDHYDCDKSVEVDYQVTTDDRNIPDFERVDPCPEGWSIDMRKREDNWSAQEPCACPEHNPYNNKSKHSFIMGAPTAKKLEPPF